jgi:hypothetical protein
MWAYKRGIFSFHSVPVTTVVGEVCSSPGRVSTKTRCRRVLHLPPVRSTWRVADHSYKLPLICQLPSLSRTTAFCSQCSGCCPPNCTCVQKALWIGKSWLLASVCSKCRDSTTSYTAVSEKLPHDQVDMPFQGFDVCQGGEPQARGCLGCNGIVV